MTASDVGSDVATSVGRGVGKFVIGITGASAYFRNSVATGTTRGLQHVMRPDTDDRQQLSV
jgi:hypothetical protein